MHGSSAPHDVVRPDLSRRGFLARAGFAAAGLGSVAAACSPFRGEVDDEKSGSTTIRFITPADLGLERTLYKGFLKDFEKTNKGTKVTVTFEAWDDYMAKLPTLLAGGAVPDLIHQHQSIVQDYGHRNALLDLAPLMKRDGIQRSAFVPALIDNFSDGGKIYGLPKDSAAWGVYYNKDMFDAAGVAYPKDDWTMDDLRETARKLTRDKQGRSPGDPGFDGKQIKQWGLNWLAPTPTDSENSRAFVRAFGGDWYDAKYQKTLVDRPPAIADFEFFRSLRCTDRSTPSPSQELGQGDPFRSGLTAMTVSHHSQDFFLRQEKTKFPWGITFVPKGPGGQFVAVGCSGWAIPKQAKNKEAAWRLLKHLTSPPVQQGFAKQHRWAPSVRSALDSLVPDKPTEGFVKVHVDPLRERSDRTVISLKFPANQSRIKEIYATNFDPLWATCATEDVAGAAARTRAQVDSILAQG
ncbi:sugar ABC transporter substrate-binding protein [Actinopolymorpha sp. NPDC004070]|uniref:ABC transporter substrate-binding protein n=1 Tax=Actinopolymorpha sp. NPDC004070 TaxID=3154548 RepID=UPI0033BE2206